MTPICAECGALLSDGDTCQTIFEHFLTLEFSDQAYGAVHFLTVACFMIQHGRYSDEGLAWIQKTLLAYLDENMTPEQLRKFASKDTGNQTRKWKVTRAADAPPAPKIAWSMTIADVAKNYTDAESYCALIKQWAHITSRELEAA